MIGKKLPIRWGLAKRYQLNKQIIGINETLVEYLQYGTLGAAGVLASLYPDLLPGNIRG